MDNFFYYSSMRYMTAHFLDIFGGIKVKKFDKAGNPVKTINVPVKLSGKQKFHYWSNERSSARVLPMMAAQLTSCTYAEDRVTNNAFKLYRDGSEEGEMIEVFQPVPYDFDFQIYVAALYMTDISQILEQILPYFAPHVMMRVRIPEAKLSYDAKVVMTGNSPDMEIEMSEDSMRTLIWTMDFTVKGYLLRPIERKEYIRKVVAPLHYGFNSSEGKEPLTVTEEGYTDPDSIDPQIVREAEAEVDAMTGELIAKYEVLPKVESEESDGNEED